MYIKNHLNNIIARLGFQYFANNYVAWYKVKYDKKYEQEICKLASTQYQNTVLPSSSIQIIQ